MFPVLIIRQLTVDLVVILFEATESDSRIHCNFMLADLELHEPLVDDFRVSSFKSDEVIHLNVDHRDAASAASARLLLGTRVCLDAHSPHVSSTRERTSRVMQ